MPNNRTTLHLIWGVMLTLAGVGVFFRIPEVMPQIRSIPQFSTIIPFIYFCFYLIGVLLIAGGLKKIIGNMKKR